MNSENFTWEDSDDKYTKYESTNRISSIYEVNCPECGERVYNDYFDPDADGPSWHYECHDCGVRITVYPSKYSARASDSVV